MWHLKTQRNAKHASMDAVLFKREGGYSPTLTFFSGYSDDSSFLATGMLKSITLQLFNFW